MSGRVSNRMLYDELKHLREQQDRHISFCMNHVSSGSCPAVPPSGGATGFSGRGLSAVLGAIFGWFIEWVRGGSNG